MCDFFGNDSSPANFRSVCTRACIIYDRRLLRISADEAREEDEGNDHDDPGRDRNRIVGGIVILALSQAMNLVQSIVVLQNEQFANFFDVTSVTLLVHSAVMFAIGFHKMYAVYLNERLKVKVHSALEELANEQEMADWQTRLR